jgi:hypothetical protein
MPSPEMLRRVVLVRIYNSEERIASIIRVIGSGEIRTMVFFRGVFLLPVTANVVTSPLILLTLLMEAIHSSETSSPIRATWRNIPEGGIPHSHLRETSNHTRSVSLFQLPHPCLFREAYQIHARIVRL